MATDQELLSALRTGKPQGLEAAIGQYSAYVAAHYYKYTVFATMEALRSAVDELETITDSKYWPYPSYTDLLFSVK